MREFLKASFEWIRILDLHGSSKKVENSRDGSKDENVFDIQQGVGISLLVKALAAREHVLSHADLWGSRGVKYEVLSKVSPMKQQWGVVSVLAPNFFFVPRNSDNSGEYSRYFSLRQVFLQSSNGVKTERDAVSIHFAREGIQRAVKDFQTLDEDKLRKIYELDIDRPKTSSTTPTRCFTVPATGAATRSF
jgi:predicted helicase